MSILFLHPDLGIGGAERAIIDIAVSAKRIGYDVEIITNFHDPEHAFEDTIDGSLKITPVFQWLPRSICGRFIALFAFAKMILASIWIFLARRDFANLVFVDQVSAPIPILKLFGFKTIFFGHFPDLLLSRHDSVIRKVYRYPLDRLEEFSLRLSDTLVVNSYFTASVFKQTFPSLKTREPFVLYPVPNMENIVLPEALFEKKSVDSNFLPSSECALRMAVEILGVHPKLLFLSINRYERKKNIQLALQSFACLRENWSSLVKNSSMSPSDVYFVHAGGYDVRIRENVEHFDELKRLSERLKILDHVVLLQSVSSQIKYLLIAASSALIYTPSFEHFGIVPIEAMYLGRPVIAINAGGPRETIIDQETGFLCSISNGDAFNNDQIAFQIAEYMSRFINDPDLTTTMGKCSHDHVAQKFSTKSLRHDLALILENTLSGDGTKKHQ